MVVNPSSESPRFPGVKHVHGRTVSFGEGNSPFGSLEPWSSKTPSLTLSCTNRWDVSPGDSGGDLQTSTQPCHTYLQPNRGYNPYKWSLTLLITGRGPPCIYLEPVCPLFWGCFKLQKKAQTPIKTRVISRYIRRYLEPNDRPLFWRVDLPAILCVKSAKIRGPILVPYIGMRVLSLPGCQSAQDIVLLHLSIWTTWIVDVWRIQANQTTTILRGTSASA